MKDNKVERIRHSAMMFGQQFLEADVGVFDLVLGGSLAAMVSAQTPHARERIYSLLRTPGSGLDSCLTFISHFKNTRVMECPTSASAANTNINGFLQLFLLRTPHQCYGLLFYLNAPSVIATLPPSVFVLLAKASEKIISP
jgi:hypothetical protein